MANSNLGSAAEQNLQLPPDVGVLVVGHGTRNAVGQAEFLHVAAMLQARFAESQTAACFLELASPNIAAGVESLAQRGVRRVIVAPLLLFSAGHAKTDIPAAVAAAMAGKAELSYTMASPLNLHEQVLAISQKRFYEAVKTAKPSTDGDITLLFVGRGTSDHEAISKVHQFAAQRLAQTPVPHHMVCFLDSALPTFAEAVAWAKLQSPRTIVVQPHLLFHGQLIEDIRALIAKTSQVPGTSQKQWLIAGYLGPTPEVAAALSDRVVQAVAQLIPKFSR